MKPEADADADGRVIALLIRFQSAHRIQSVVERLRQAGIMDEHIEIVSDRPLAVRMATRSGRLVGVAVVAGIVGILLGIGLAAGTALLYPINTGGKPIVAVPVVGLIAYETMMLCAIVATITAMAIAVIRSSRRASGVPELKSDEAAVVVHLNEVDSRNDAVQDILREGDVTRLPRMSQRPIHRWCLVLALSLAGSGCSENMTDQPSYRPQEPPRLHSPGGSVPRISRVHRRQTPGTETPGGERLFRINCVHCHGSTAEGDGPVAPYLAAPPANLRAPNVQEKSASALYAIITDGEKAMPAFKGELSTDERWALVDFIGSMAGAAQATSGRTNENLDPGTALYATYCQACHGPRGKGDGPAAMALLSKSANLAVGRLKRGETTDAIARTIVEGVQGTPMPGFGYLSEHDQRALAEHVVSLRRGGVLQP